MDKIDKKKLLNICKSTLPEFYIHENQSVIKIIDCVVIGIHFGFTENSNDYSPLFFIHNLLRDFPVLSLELSKPILKNRHSKLSYQNHDFENYLLKFIDNHPIMKKECHFKKELINIYEQSIFNYYNDQTPTDPITLFQSYIKILSYYGWTKMEIQSKINDFSLYMLNKKELYIWGGEKGIIKTQKENNDLLNDLEHQDWTSIISRNIIQLKLNF